MYHSSGVVPQEFEGTISRLFDNFTLRLSSIQPQIRTAQANNTPVYTAASSASRGRRASRPSLSLPYNALLS